MVWASVFCGLDFKVMRLTRYPASLFPSLTLAEPNGKISRCRLTPLQDC